MEHIKHAMIATWKMSLDGMHQAYEDLFVKDDRKAALLTAITDVENNPISFLQSQSQWNFHVRQKTVFCAVKVRSSMLLSMALHQKKC